MIFRFVNNENMMTLPKAPLLSKLRNASENEIKVLLYGAAAAVNGSFNENDIQELSGLDITDIIIALQFWRGAEVLTIDGDTQKITVKPQNDKVKPLKKNDIPSYSGEEIASLFEKKAELGLLIDECQKIAGKIFNPLEINKIVSLYDYLGLSCEYILNLYHYCEKKRKTTVHYLETTAFSLYDSGVDTDEKLREYLKNKEEFDSVAGQIRRIFGIGSRRFTKTEERLISKWKDLYKFRIEIIEYAYELTVRATSKASLPYAGKILDNWFKAGYTTLEQAKESEFAYKKKKEEENISESSFDNDEFFEAALKRSYDNIGKSSPYDNNNQ